MKRLVKLVHNNVFSRTVLDFYFTLFGAVGDKKMPDVGVLLPLRARPLTIILKYDGPIFILIHDGLLYFVSLIF